VAKKEAPTSTAEPKFRHADPTPASATRFLERSPNFYEMAVCFMIERELKHQILPPPSNPSERVETPGPTPNQRPYARSLLSMVLVALAIRLVVMVFLLPEQLDPQRDHWHFGYEAGRIARSIVEGRGFGNPLFADTGPTAWMTPVYPYLMAGVFKVFGIYTESSAIVLLTLNALLSALVCVLVFFIARISFGNRVAKWSGWAWAFFPYGIYFPEERIWETWLATLLLCLVFLITLNLENDSRFSMWLVFGLLWGVAALTSPVLLAVLPFLAGWVIDRRQRSGRRWLAVNLVAATAFLAVISPWFVRNYKIFHRVVPFRDNMGIVLVLGTRGSNDHWGHYELGPWHNREEWNEFQRRGELGYFDSKKRQAVEFIRANPGWYAWTTVRRAFFIWTGYWSLRRDYLKEEPLDPPNILFCTMLTVLALIGLWRAWQADWSAALPYALVLFAFPLVYYITSPEAYYRRPIDPFFVILAVAGVLSSKKQGWPESATLGELKTGN
jgi:4-amino-4-deoxy-L-arabinose transferase-like glycosyltransferase